ncbi:hypothetical protein [Membranihabitans marinus]|uniref:hypothetical protein n=1 Tax=Membranihabitans marinus TaxID=1227546 RepID=UPI001F17D7B7|nr:hypothetical protein [Membranihabitans marinus]
MILSLFVVMGHDEVLQKSVVNCTYNKFKLRQDSLRTSQCNQLGCTSLSHPMRRGRPTHPKWEGQPIHDTVVVVPSSLTDLRSMALRASFSHPHNRSIKDQ